MTATMLVAATLDGCRPTMLRVFGRRGGEDGSAAVAWDAVDRDYFSRHVIHASCLQHHTRRINLSADGASFYVDECVVVMPLTAL